MPAGLRKTLIAMASALVVMTIYMFFDPTLRDFLYALILRVYLLAIGIVAKFAFKGGVISIATIAWKRIFFVGGLALFKRFWINFAKKNAITHVLDPLKPVLKKWFQVHFQMFKNQPRWAQFSESALGSAILIGLAYFFGAISYVWSLIMKVLTGQLQNFFLSILGLITGVFKFIWSKIQPWLDIILITAAIEMIEKIPGVRFISRKTRQVKNAVVERKDKAIKAVVHTPVQKVAAAIENHADKKMKKQQELAAE